MADTPGEDGKRAWTRHQGQSGLMARVQRAWGPGPLQSARMKGPAPDRLLHRPIYPRTVDPLLARTLLTGHLAAGKTRLSAVDNPAALWASLCQTDPDYEALHRFAWLPGLALFHVEATVSARHAGKPSAETMVYEEDGEDENDTLTAPQRLAIALTTSWLDSYERWSPDAWSAPRLADRLLHLCCHADLLLTMGDTLWRSRLLNSMARQTRHLAQIAHKGAPGTPMMITAMGLLLAGLCLPGCAVAVERGQELTRREFRLQVRPDGGHLSRNPSTQLELTLRLKMIAEAYAARGIAVPGHVRLTLARMAAIVDFFRIADGKLAVFSGGCEGDPQAVIAATQSADPQTRPSGFARDTKFQRLSASRALLIVDVGSATAQGRKAFAGASSFHFSSGRMRIIVNCGQPDERGPDWDAAMRQASAHSTFSLDGDPGLREGLFAGETNFQRAEEVSGLLLEMARPFSFRLAQASGAGAGTGGAPPTEPRGGMAREGHAAGGAIDHAPGHFRRLFLAAGGADFRGEDRLMGLPARFWPHWRLRFHLHPTVKASLARDGQSVILVLPNQEGWRFRSSFAGLKLEKSVYFGREGRLTHTEQIVIAPFSEDESGPGPAGALDSAPWRDIIIKWAFKRLDGI
ncbi:MAG: heparinase II/III family protein [Pseudomonadota bacterium]